MTKTLWGVALALAMFVALPAQACYYIVLPVHVLAAGGCSGPPGGGSLPSTAIASSINLDTVYTGNLPSGAAPWLRASFAAKVGESSGTLTLYSGLAGAETVQGLAPGVAAAGWAFNLSQLVTGVSYVSGTEAATTAYASDIGLGPIPASFNLAFGWSSANSFGTGDAATYTLTFANPLASDPFAANAAGWYSTAYLQDIDGSGCSAWIVAGSGSGADGSSPCVSTPPTTPPTTPVPEPAGLGVFGFGMLLVGAFVGLRRRTA